MRQIRWTLAAGLAAASAFSAMPSAFYHLVDSPWPLAWTTPALFVAHGLAQVAAMTAVLRRSGPSSPDKTVAGLLVLDAAAGLVLVAAPAHGARGLLVLLVGRVLTGVVLGLIVPLVSRELVGADGGPAVVTAAMLGGVGIGSLAAGALAASGLGRSQVLAVGVGALLVAAFGAALGRRSSVRAPWRTPEVRRSAERVGPHASPRGAVAVALTLAFAANGLLAVFTSTLPGVVAGLGHGSALLAGATAGTVMLAAGAARLPLAGLPGRAVRVIGVVAALVGAVALGAGLARGVLVAALAGGVLLGAAAGIGVEAAFALAAGAGDGGRSLIRVQRSAQLGLVVPVACWPLFGLLVGPSTAAVRLACCQAVAR